MDHQTTKIKLGRWILLAVIVVACLYFILSSHPHKTASTVQASQSVENLDIPAITKTETDIPENTTITKKTPKEKKSEPVFTTITIKRGDTLYRIFKNRDLNYNTLKKIIENPEAKKYLTHLYPGERFYLYKDPHAQKIEIKYPINDDETFYIDADQGTVTTHLHKLPLTKRLLYKEATISHTFAETARQAGLTHTQMFQLSKIFEGTVNFSRDIRPGDHFSILYDEYYLNGKKERPGNILAATFTNQGNKHTILRFTYPRNHSGYFTPDGHGVEPLFTMHPVRYKRISSYFTLHRYDPVLHIIHPHLGIDFAAPVGTPIKSIGEGKVIFHGWKGGYGKAVIVRYSKKYKALYGHMSRFAKNLYNGEPIKKGQIIGFIGSSGWSTGPHLHFEMYVYGIPRDPLKMKFIGGKPVPKAYLQTFHEKTETLLAYLKMYQGQEFAMVDETGHEKE